MDATVELEDGPKAIIKLGTLLYQFRLPTVEHNINFTSAFRQSTTPQLTISHLERTDRERKVIIDDLSPPEGSPINAASVAVSCERYIPDLQCLIKSIDGSVEPVRLNQRMEFTWGSTLNSVSNDQKTQEVFIFEIAMTMATKALAHVNSAFPQNIGAQSSTGDRFKEAGKQLAFSSGIFRTLASDFLPRWKETRDNASGRHPETSDGVALAMSDIILGLSQAMAIAKAIQLGKTPDSVLCKLAVGVTEKLEKGVSNFRGRAGIHFQRLDPSFLTYLTFMISYYKSLSFYFFAKAENKDGHYGSAIAALGRALELSRERESVGHEGIPQIQGTFLATLQNDIALYRCLLRTTLEDYNSTNNLVYFERVPQKSDADFPQLPSSIMVMQPTPYQYYDESTPILKFTSGEDENKEDEKKNDL